MSDRLKNPKYDYLVLGAGRQGTAAAYDLAIFGQAKSVTLSDASAHALASSGARLRGLLAKAGCKAEIRELVAVTFDQVMTSNRFDSCICALPYTCGEGAALAAIRARLPMCDLGCDTGVVQAQLRLDDAAKAAGVAIVPDCGLAPGTSTMFAMHVLRLADKAGMLPDSVRLYCGGLPLHGYHNDLPMGYKLVFSPEGLVNNYLAQSVILEAGEVKVVDSLGGLEDVDFHGMRLEAFYTHGGASLLPWRLRDKGINDFSYKTLRYHGHAAQLRLLRDLGLMGQDTWREKIAPKLAHPEVPDMVLLRATCMATPDRRLRRLPFGYKDTGSRPPPCSFTLDLIDREDTLWTGFSAMERTTGFSAGIVAWMLASGKEMGLAMVHAGVQTPDKALSSDEYMDELVRRNFKIEVTSNGPL